MTGACRSFVPPLQSVRKPAVQEFVDSVGVDVALTVDAQEVLREVLGGVAPDLLPIFLDIKPAVVTRVA